MEAVQSLSWSLFPFASLSPLQLHEIMKLRQEVFVVEQHCPFVDADSKDLVSHHLVGKSGADLAAYARIVPAGAAYTEVSIGRIVTSGKYRRHGFGRKLMEQVLAETKRLYGPVPIRIGAQLYLKKFYEDYGFIQQDEPYVEDDILHIIMLRP